MSAFAPRRYQAGFTLLEAAIILIVIGLIVGSATVGRHLIKQAKLKSIIVDVRTYQNAIDIFRDKYYSFPGDMPNASEFWSTGISGICPNNSCNGNGNEQIIGDSGGLSQNEGYRAWQHLMLSNMILGKFDGLGRGAGNEAIIGDNVPKSKFGEGGFFLHYWNISGQGNALNFGAFQAEAYNFAPVLIPGDAFHIDEKTDDGLPRSGSVWAGGNGGVGQCYTASSYNIAEGTVQCAMHFWISG